MNKLAMNLALVSGAAIAAATPALATHSWGGYHWAGSGSELPLRVNTAITSQWQTSVTDSIADWNSSNELSLSRANSSASPKRCNPISGQILVCNDTYGQRGWLGIASIWLTNNHISSATTKLNDSYFNTPQYNTAAWRALVACQEIGHDFGLDHQDEGFSNVNLGTCMDYTNAPDGGNVGGFNYGPANRHANKHDYDMLNTIYNHNDGFTTAKASVPSTMMGLPMLGQRQPVSYAGVGDSPVEWGRAIHRDKLGRPDLFEKQLGPRERVLTHVFWALGQGPR